MEFKIASKQIDDLKRTILNKEKVMLRGLQDAERAFLLSQLNNRFLYVATSYNKAKIIEKQLASCGKSVQVINQVVEPLTYEASINDALMEILKGLSRFIQGGVDALIITPEVLLQKLPTKNVFLEHCIKLNKGETYDYLSLKSALLNLGYKRVEKVENENEFASRGDILDVFPIGSECAYRLDFWGNELESIKSIDLTAYTSVNDVDKLNVFPCTFNLGKLNDDISFLSDKSEIIDKIDNGIKDNSLIFALPAYSEFNSNFISWFSDSLIVVEEPKRLYDVLNDLSFKFTNDLIRQIEEGLLKKQHLNYYVSTKNLFIKDKQAVIGFSNLDVKNPIFYSDNAISFSLINLSNYLNNDELLKSDLQYFSNQKFTVLLSYSSDEQKSILKAILSNAKLMYNESEEIVEGKINLTLKDIAYSVGLLNEKFVFISQANLFRQVKKVESSQSKSRVFYLPKIGDYVVHEVQGVGKCIDIKKMNFGFCEKDYIVIEYAKGDILYLPTEHTDEISQYLGGETQPKLNVLGGEQFEKAKEKARSSIKKLAFDLKKLYAERSTQKGFVYSSDNYLVDEFQKACGFELTKDQEDAIIEIKNDMQSGKVMDRLICGDVGFGKTEVAFVAAFKTILENKQVAFLAPTTILCHQHFTNATNRMKDFLVNVAMLSRFNTAKENENVIKGLASGEINMVCGTHRMLSDDVKFKDLGLLILDEEQRFGVADKEKIKRLKQNVNVLTLSATPIPRTLHMSLVGIRDTSLITTPPKSRLPITSVVCEYSSAVVKEACTRELLRGGQVLIVYNRVDTIIKFASQIKELMPDASIDVAHGQMDKNTLEDVVLKLYSNETQILIATTLIENGVDLPMANTLIVVNADTLGLSQLYQLRGRVGRSNRTSYAYFTFDKDKMINENAMKRLDALKEFSELGSGFKIAMRDLEIRGAGSILGAEQHGHIEKIGYDLYCKLLEEEIANLDGDNGKILRDVKIEIAIPAYAPETYIESSDERMKLYNKISLIKSENDKNEIIKQLVDIYGKLPNELLQLIEVGYIKNIAKNCFIKKIVINDFVSNIEFYEDENEIIKKAESILQDGFLSIKQDNMNLIRFIIDKTLPIRERQQELIKFLLKLQKSVA